MSDNGRSFDRRSFVLLTGAASVACTAGLAGCLGDGEGDGNVSDDTGDEELPEGVNESVFREGPVPEEYRTATSQAGEERRPASELATKASVSFMEASDARSQGLGSEGQSCSNCADFIPDMNGDGFGACAEVEGYIGGDDWCSLWESVEEETEEDGESSGEPSN